MKNYYLTIILLLFGSMLFAQQQTINSFDVADPDTNYWQFFDNHGGQHYQTSDNADSALGWIDISYPTNDVAEGSGAMLLKYSANNSEGWGGYTKLEHWNPDSNGVYDWSVYDTLSFYYNNTVAQDLSGRVHLRVNLHEVSEVDGYKAYDVGDTEYYYSFQYILDNEPGWNRIDIPLLNNASWDGMGFNLTGWSGITGNSVLDKDKIKGYSFEFSINGGGEGDHAVGEVLIDHLHLRGIAEKPWLIFNGKTVNNSFTQFTWGQSNLELIEGGGIDPNTNALLWTQGDEWANGWSGAGWNVDPFMDLGVRWQLDSVRFAMKAEAGTNSPIRLQFESAGDPGGAWGTLVDVMADDQWHEYVVALKDFVNTDGAKPDWDSTQISAIQFMGEGNATAGKKVYFDYIWTGNPEIDVIAPIAPAGPIAVGGEYINLVTWIDIPGESDAAYTVLYSSNPITAIDDEGVGVVEMGVAPGLQLATHVLTSPMTDAELTYYYAVYAVDAAGNIGELASIDAVTNNARGITSIYPEAPAGFAIDGDLSEWSSITSYKMYPEDGSGSIVTNTVIDNNADLSVDAYVAIDDNYLYVAFDVEDDVIDVDSTDGETWMRDAPDLFIGFYDQKGAPHTSYKRGEEPDYHFRFSPHQLLLDISGGGVLAKQGPDYIWEEKFPSGYVVEAKISLDTLAARGGDERFYPQVGMKLPIDYSINDADGARREGILTYSPINEDKSWGDVSLWFHSWIGDQMTDVDGNSTMPENYSLSQNYPNPFNPSTIINYSVVNKGNVSLRVFNILGQEVKTLINKVQAPGTYQVNFNASDLATGMYIYQIQSGSFVSSKKMMLIK